VNGSIVPALGGGSVPRAGLVTRISNALLLDTGDPQVVLFGLASSGMLVSADYREHALEESLWQALHASFRRIVFSSANSPVYFLEEASRHFISLRVREASRRGQDASRSRAESATNLACGATSTGGECA
jgi:hypothetical protein